MALLVLFSLGNGIYGCSKGCSLSRRSWPRSTTGTRGSFENATMYHEQQI